MKKKQWEERFFKSLSAVATYSIFICLGWILFMVLREGVPALSVDMVTKIPEAGFYFGKDGGILNAIVGSFYLAFGATFIAIIVSLPIALFMNIHMVAQRKRLRGIRLILDILWGIPSIVYGAFGFTLMLAFGMRASLLAGTITVAFLIIPIMIRAMDEVIRTVPTGLMEASFSLGSTRLETSVLVYVRKAFPGLITAVLMSLGRGIGDAASVLFTAGFTDYLPENIMQPVATLPLAIFFQLSSPISEVRDRAYAAAVILTLIILLFSLAGRGISNLFNKNIRHGSNN